MSVKTILLLFFFSFFSFFKFALAAPTTINIDIRSPIITTSFQDVITRIGGWLLALGLVLTPLMVFVGAYMLITGGGNPTKIALGKKIILFTLIGFTIIMITRGIIELARIILGF